MAFNNDQKWIIISLYNTFLVAHHSENFENFRCISHDDNIERLSQFEQAFFMVPFSKNSKITTFFKSSKIVCGSFLTYRFIPEVFYRKWLNN